MPNQSDSYTTARSGLLATVPLYLKDVTVDADGFITDYQIAYLLDFVDPDDIKEIVREAINLDEPERCEVYDRDRFLEGHPGTPPRRATHDPTTNSTEADPDAPSASDAPNWQWPPRPCTPDENGEPRAELIALMRRASRSPGDLSPSDFLMEVCKRYAISDDDMHPS